MSQSMETHSIEELKKNSDARYISDRNCRRRSAIVDHLEYGCSHYTEIKRAVDDKLSDEEEIAWKYFLDRINKLRDRDIVEAKEAGRSHEFFGLTEYGEEVLERKKEIGL